MDTEGKSKFGLLSRFALPKLPPMSRVLKADVQVLCAAMFFGIGFLAQRSVSVHGLGAMTCNAFRFGLSTILLIIFRPYLPKDIGLEGTEEGGEGEDGNAPLVNKSDDEDSADESAVKNIDASSSAIVKGKDGFVMSLFNRLLGPLSSHIAVWKRSPWFWGILLGCINFGGSGFQQWGIHYTTASKLAFIAGFDLFLTPIFGLFIPSFKKAAKAKPSTWIAVSTSVLGLYYISGARMDDFEMGFGETLVVISTIFWTMHITYTDIATGYVDCLQMMAIQMGVVAALSAFAAFFIESREWTIHHIIEFMPLLIFLAVSEGLGFVLMALGQSFSPPTHAAIILSLEGVFSSVASFFILGELLTLRESFGCFLMLASTFIAKIGFGVHEDKLDRLCGGGGGGGGNKEVEMGGNSSSSSVTSASIAKSSKSNGANDLESHAN